MIAATQLSKSYGKQRVVSEVSFTCRPGTVTGFLGPNGAGKSTTLRMICGLTTPTSGSATVHGRPYREFANPARQIGVLLDAAAQHPGRTGREALTLAALTIGVDRRRVGELLDLVDLSPAAARKRVGSYSLGMRQRLGLAQALLADPDVVVLDEPANGLDPQGIHWLRGLLRELADRGGTVLLSSHLLLEVEAVADQLVVIAGGRIVAQGSKHELLAAPGVLVRALDRPGLIGCLARGGISFTEAGDGALLVQADAEAVGRAALAAGLVLLELRAADSQNLERLFLKLTGPDRLTADPVGAGPLR